MSFPWCGCVALSCTLLHDFQSRESDSERHFPQVTQISTTCDLMKRGSPCRVRERRMIHLSDFPFRRHSWIWWERVCECVCEREENLSNFSVSSCMMNRSFNRISLHLWDKELGRGRCSGGRLYSGKGYTSKNFLFFWPCGNICLVLIKKPFFKNIHGIYAKIKDASRFVFVAGVKLFFRYTCGIPLIRLINDQVKKSSQC